MASQTHPGDRPTWHDVAAATVLERTGSSTAGLSDEQAALRLRQHGPNRLRPPQRRSPLLRLLSQFHNVLIYVLLGAAALTAVMSHWVDTGVILGVVVINAVIGFLQEGKAEKALHAIRGMLSRLAAVRRGGRCATVAAEDVVPGDVVQLQSGDRVPADLRLFSCKGLKVDEAILTGESAPVEKTTEPVAHDAVLGDRNCMAWSGTLVTYGQACGVVVATGDATEIGRISTLLERVEVLTTPLLRQIADFSRGLSGAILAIAAATFAFGVFVRGYSAGEMFLAAVGIAVAAVPEGLPAVMTITLAIGVQRMARRRAIIRRLPAVETLGAVTVICTDKTGTLTRNEMTVSAVATATALFEISGVGYDPHGDFFLDGRPVAIADYPVLTELARAAALCNDAAVNETAGAWLLHGDPTEGALVVMSLKGGLDPARQKDELPRTDVIPFESEHRFMASLHHDHAGHGFIYIKGAPEQVLSMCNRQRAAGEDIPIDTRYWHERMEEMAARGQRLLALAFRTAAPGQSELHFRDLEAGLTLLGIVGIIDPPRHEALAAVRRCRDAGVDVKMITGDHAGTAAAIAEQVGVGGRNPVVTGADLEHLDDVALRRTVQEADVFARASPEHKLRLVRALQANGEVVAMTGDGVNDAPALRRADIGVAMGKKGTEVAREASEMVLVDDNFASIVSAVEEGRTVYDNLRKAILFLLPTSVGEAMILIAAIAMGMVLPITPVQILWVNMITAVTLGLALAFEPTEPGVMQRPPRNPRESLLSGFFLWRVLLVSLIMVAGTFGLYLQEVADGAQIAHARTVAVNTLAMFELFYLFSARYLLAPVLNRKGIVGNPYVLWFAALLLLFQLAFTYLEPMQLMFGTVTLAGWDWLRIVLVATSVLWLVEAEKWVMRRWRPSRR